MTLDDLPLDIHLDFISGWSPPRSPSEFYRQRDRFQSWTEFLDVYRQVRAEFLAERPARKSDGRPLFAELVLQFVDRFGLARLEALGDVHYEYLADALGVPAA